MSILPLVPRVLRFAARRETLAVALAAAVVGFGVTHRHKAVPGEALAERGWVGQLASATTIEPSMSQPLSSSSLVVPPAALALPPVPKKAIQVKAACDSADRTCAVRSATPATGAKRPTAVSADAVAAPPLQRVAENQHSDMIQPANAKGVSLNPLDHLPDIGTLGRPFTAAGTTISSWVKRL